MSDKPTFVSRDMMTADEGYVPMCNGWPTSSSVSAKAKSRRRFV